jgi:FKBP-type peptidyl-prolyl cis-trans isomerase SlyD
VKATADRVVSIDYTLTDDEGEVLDTSSGGEPLVYLHGRGQIVPGLERAIEGREAGESLEVEVAARDGYGDRDESKVMQMPRSELPKGLSPEVGMELAAEGPRGEVIPVWLTEVDDASVTLDANHPLAGQTLHFRVEIREVRAATSEELAHGHVHGPGGHH